MSRLYGTLTIDRGRTIDDPDAMLYFAVEPHVAIRLKRVFKDARSDGAGVITLSA